jgi:hypothetical protein
MSETKPKTTTQYDNARANGDIILLTKTQYQRGDCPRCNATPGRKQLCKHIVMAHDYSVEIQYRCDNCDSLDSKSTREFNLDKGNYCSRTCTSTTPAERVMAIDEWPDDESCPTCGRQFDSRTSMAIHHARTHDEKLRVGRECQHDRCDERIVAKMSEIERGRAKYCSVDCRDESKSNRVPLPDVVLVPPATSSAQVYHTRLNCDSVDDNNWTRSREWAEADEDLEECSRCKSLRGGRDV